MSVTSRSQDSISMVDSLQEFYSVILEYYDELFPLDEGAVGFIERLRDEFRELSPVKPPPLYRLLTVGCATGGLENRLAGNAMDITGIDRNPDMVATAKRRMHHGASTTRFFEMSTLEMNRFLKKGSFHLVACLDNTLTFIADDILIRKFFHDVRELLSPGGRLLVQTLNFDGIPESKPLRLPERSSIRVRLDQGYIPSGNGKMILDAMLELGSGKRIQLQRETPILPLPSQRVAAFAMEAGFTGADIFGDFFGSPLTGESQSAIFLFS